VQVETPVPPASQRYIGKETTAGDFSACRSLSLTTEKQLPRGVERLAIKASASLGTTL
jgi:hypothetical protein